MLVRHFHHVHELPNVLAQPTDEMGQLCLLLCEQGQFPFRRTWERQMFTIPEMLLLQIGCLGRQLVALIQPWENLGRAVAIDSTILCTHGSVWQQKHRDKGEISPPSINTEAY